MEFYEKHNLDYRKFQIVLSSWKGESSWRVLKQGFPVLLKPKLKSKLELRILEKTHEDEHPRILNPKCKKARIKVDEYQCDWLDKGSVMRKTCVDEYQ
jgi:hypothetical protein